MGVQVRITVYAPDEQTGDDACRAAFARIAELEDILSDYRGKSELNRLCARGPGAPVPLSGELFTVLQHAQQLAERSRGAFDATIGAYTHLWRGSRRTGELPTDAEWLSATERVGWEYLELDAEEQTARLLLPEMQLDLGGIAKGYALDEGLRVLSGLGLPGALLSAGGDIRVGEPPPGRDGWRVKVWGAAPEREWLTVSSCGVSTSGDTEQFVEVEGNLVSHIIDPRQGLRHGEPLLATIVAPNAMTSDALATACVVLGEEAAEELVEGMPGVTAHVRVATTASPPTR